MIQSTITLIINLVSSQFNSFLWAKIIWNIMLKFNNCITIKDIYILHIYIYIYLILQYELQYEYHPLLILSFK